MRVMIRGTHLCDEFFKECVQVFEEDGRAVPDLNNRDKHLSYSFVEGV